MKINLTSAATEKLKELVESKEENKCLKIFVAAYGWGGPTFGLALEEPKEDDELFQSGEFKFAIEKELSDIYKTFTVDYNDDSFRRGFLITLDGAGNTSC